MLPAHSISFQVSTEIESIQIIRLQIVRVGSFPYSPKRIRSPRDVARIFRSFLPGADREYFVVLLLNGKHQVNALNVVAIGSLMMAVVSPREVFKPAVEANAAAMVVCHNHPSGDPTPSREDHALTQRLVQAGQIIGIPVQDHVIVGEKRHVSFAKYL